MTQTLYAHMNKRYKKRERERQREIMCTKKRRQRLE
jgi:hypothetical protein